MNRRRAVIIVGVLAALVAAVFFIRSRSEPAPGLRIGSGEFRVLIADDSAEQVRGLSGMPSLPDDTVMLFIFPADGRYGIWMKDMRFAIDIVWLDAGGVVTDVRTSVRPDSYPEVFRPSRPARYVVEMNAGTARRTGLRAGQQIELPN